ncbi:MAG: 2-amino-4-hydroxy-6-hydroxymethyldihydropteridine diphosphokinase [Bacteroidetes bacterium]|nr:MAG: 2-amino-4-hydroxy-6-hydroxymethyldihydropteridine diphosphokinase [Bacteroidota bacterium]
MSKLILLLGSNLGVRNRILEKAINAINESIGFIDKTSSLYQTEPWGFDSKDLFLNQVVSVETTLNPMEVLVKVQEIENRLGRVRTANRYSSRTIDIDILFYDNLTVDMKELQIPHPRLHERRFTLIPLLEVVGGFFHPVLNQRIDVLAENCSDKSRVELLA